MTTKTSILIRRYILGLEPKIIFSRKDLRKFGNKNAVDLAIYHFTKRGEIVRLFRGVYLRKEASNWKPSPEEIAKIKAATLGRLITEDSVSVIKKLWTMNKYLINLQTKEVLFSTLPEDPLVLNTREKQFISKKRLPEK